MTIHEAVETASLLRREAYIAQNASGANAGRITRPDIPTPELELWKEAQNEALAWLERTVAAHDAGAVSLKIEPAWDGLRSDPRFVLLLARTNQVP
jgi:hypothetical protein